MELQLLACSIKIILEYFSLRSNGKPLQYPVSGQLQNTRDLDKFFTKARNGHVILFSRYLVLTAVNWP